MVGGIVSGDAVAVDVLVGTVGNGGLVSEGARVGEAVGNGLVAEPGMVGVEVGNPGYGELNCVPQVGPGVILVHCAAGMPNTCPAKISVELRPLACWMADTNTP